MEKALLSGQYAILHAFHAIMVAGKELANLMNYILPKGIELDPEAFQSYIDSFQQQKDSVNRIYHRVGSCNSTNPLREAAAGTQSKQLEKNTAQANDELS